MMRRFLAGLLSVAMILTMITVTPVSASPEESEELGTNIAPKATAGASYTNMWNISTTAMNDGELAGSDPSTSWNSWGGGDENYPVTTSLTWNTEQVISGMRVSWWADNAELQASNNVTFPKRCEVHYVDADGNPQRITGMVNENGDITDEVGVLYDSSSDNGINGSNQYWNYVTFAEPITTKELQMKIERNGSGSNGVGISEWEVYGTPVDSTLEENVAPNATASADAQNTPVTNVNNGRLAEGADSSWNTWNSSTYPTTVTLTWDAPHELSGMRVMYWADNADLQASGNVTFPKSCEVEYYDHCLHGHQ